MRLAFPRVPRPSWPFRRSPKIEPGISGLDPQPEAPELGAALRAFRAAALWGIAVLIMTAAGSAFAESYRGLWLWAQHHGLAGFWAAAFPLQIDLFVAVGELVLFIAMIDRWKWRVRAGAWAVALLGLAASVAGNVGHVAAHDLQSRGTAAVPPVAAFAALWLGLGVLKRVVAARAETEPAPASPAAVEGASPGAAVAVSAVIPTDAESAALIALRATLSAGNGYSNNQLMSRFGISRAQATRVRELALAGANGHHPQDTTENTD